MKDFNLNKINVLKQMKELKLNNKASQGTPSGEMAKLQKSILMQAGLALLTIVLTVVILFAVTSAWYTNVVPMDGLVFNVETWNFNGKVEVSNVETYIAPGDEGIISLTAQNDNDSIVELSVSIDKTSMLDDMQKRLFFYVDTEITRNEETMDRVYLNSSEDYKYTIFNKGVLKLQEDVYNAPRIKWHWVYDLLGYYVIAKPITINEKEIGRMEIKEYLRPIEYDYDNATFVLADETETAADGTETNTKTFKLASIGEKSVAEFIKEITETDGYEGSIEFENENAEEGVYYPVSVDEETGEGVYLYLCTYTEIEMATMWDTKTGEIAYTAANDPNDTDDTLRIRPKVTINISAQNSEIVATEIATAEALKGAIAEGTSSVFKLTDNIILTETLTIPENANVMIDLNGNTINGSVTKTADEKTAVIEAKEGSSITLINGNIDVGNENKNKIDYAVKSVGAEVVMSEVNILNSDYGVYVGDNLVDSTKDSKDSVVYISGCEINSSTCSVFVSGNGTVSEKRTTVIIENSTLKAKWYAICGNGSQSRWGTDIQVINSDITVTEYACIYQPQSDSSLTFSGCTVEGIIGMAIKGGNVTIIDTNITATGEAVKEPTAFEQSGFNATNDAIYIETNYGYPISLEIKGNSRITSNNNKAIRVYEPNAENVTISIYGGTFSSELDESWIAEGSEMTEYENGDAYVYVKAEETDTTN